MITNQVNCLNCEQPFKEDCNFCPNCGQENNDTLTVRVLFYNTISNYFSFDAKFLKSFIPLMFRPGYLAKRFVEGKRLRYLHPGQMYLFVSVLFFFVFSFTVNDWITKADKANEDIVKGEFIQVLDDDLKQKKDSILNNVIKTPLNINLNDSSIIAKETNKFVDSLMSFQKKYNENPFSFDFGITKKEIDLLKQNGLSDVAIMEEMGMEEDAGFMLRGFYSTMLDLTRGNGAGNLIKRFVDTIPIAMFFLLPIFALILKVFYFKRGRYAHHLVFCFYFFSFLFTVFTILLAFDRFISDIPVVISVLTVLSTFIYFYLSLIYFYKRNWFTTFIKSGIITFVFLLMIIPIAFAMIGAFAFANV